MITYVGEAYLSSGGLQWALQQHLKMHQAGLALSAQLLLVSSVLASPNPRCVGSAVNTALLLQERAEPVEPSLSSR